MMANVCSSTLQPLVAAGASKTSRKSGAAHMHIALPRNQKNKFDANLRAQISRQSRSSGMVLASESEGPLSSLSLSEAAALDDLIDMLLDAKSTKDLSAKVAENALSFDQSFWLRLAARADTAQEDEQKDRLRSLANVVMQILDALVKKTDEQLIDSSEVLQEILIAGAEENGQWEVPLSDSKMESMRLVMDSRADQLDEALLSSCFAFMKKASDDNLDGMVLILQTVLQLYASRELASSGGENPGEAERQLIEVLSARESNWANLIVEKAKSGDISEESFMEALQKKMENIVLSLSSGSYAQRVQAEYLKELETRAKGIFDSI
eukprot:jgi/Picsp_1/1265/NSC_04746-R1_protein